MTTVATTSALEMMPALVVTPDSTLPLAKSTPPA